VLQRIVAIGCALGFVGQPEMGQRRALEVTAANRKALASLQRAQTLEPVVILLGHDRRLLG
jgi:hypothetical protein